MIVVSNSSPLIGLAKAGRLRLLRALYREVLIPPKVFEDVVVQGRGRAGSRAVATAVREGWIRVVAVRDARQIPPRFRDTGEGEAIALCLEQQAEFLIVDDRAARNECTRRTIPWVTAVGVIRDAKRRGRVRRAKPIFDRMIARGFGIADYQAILQSIGE
ncbi:MAG: DUF3368 domain-containing protein [Planctomycetia bacterium]|nr:DUF3368 domain-containing protein [Planctomycetia bacterium]